MLELRVAVDGGKDSLSMAAAAGGETVMAPGNLVVSAYVTCPDITATVTPDLKAPAAGSRLLHVDLGEGRRRLGGSALAQVYAQVRAHGPSYLPGSQTAQGSGLLITPPSHTWRRLVTSRRTCALRCSRPRLR